MNIFQTTSNDNDKRLQKWNEEYKWDEYTRYNG
jgi:hypothetical protein